jgi:predicted DNA-binding transcriptional regulator AlpA
MSRFLMKPINSAAPANQHQSASSATDSAHESGCDETRLLRERQAADLLTLSVKTLRNWRLSGFGPSYLIVGRRLVRYRVSDLNAWLKTCKRSSTSDKGGDHG